MISQVVNIFLCEGKCSKKVTCSMQGNGRFTRDEMDDLAGRAQEIGSSFKKHFDPFTGNYDAEVLKAAAASRATTVVFFDNVEGVETINLSGRDDRLLGLILHLRRRLWIAIRQHKGLWYNFDSTKATPLVFCDGAPGLRMFLDKVVDEGGVVTVVLKPPPVASIMLAQRPPPSFTDLEYWKNWLFR